MRPRGHLRLLHRRSLADLVVAVIVLRPLLVRPPLRSVQPIIDEAPASSRQSNRRERPRKVMSPIYGALRLLWSKLLVFQISMSSYTLRHIMFRKFIIPDLIHKLRFYLRQPRKCTRLVVRLLSCAHAPTVCPLFSGS